MTALLLPGLVAALASVTAAFVHRWLRPSTAAPVLALVAVATALAVVWSLVLLAVGFLAHVAWLANMAAWCRTIGVAHVAVPPAAGIMSVVLLTSMLWSLFRSGLRHRRLRVQPSPHSELVVLPIDQPTAYAVPGRPGHIVVSRGMLRALDDDERRVLLAHERAHLRLRHDQYLRLVDIAVAVVPLLAPMASRVRFATERWADEEAAAHIGDRRLVARAVAQAALVSSGFPSPSLALGGLGVPARVDALLGDAPSRGAATGAVVAVAGVAFLAVAGSTIQFHHLLAYASSVCSIG